MLERFLTQVGFSSVDISHVFDFWDFVPRNLASGVAPLRAYRKTIQFRLKFRLIRSPETSRKSIQLEPLQISNLSLRLDSVTVFSLALCIHPLGRILKTARADLFFCQIFVHVF